MSPNSQDSIKIAPGQNYSCNACGKGCRMPWKIKVDLHKTPLIKQTKVFQKLEREGYTPLLVVNESEVQVGRGHDGACVFLKDNLCGIHAETGYESKPSVCQLYPFSTINSPDGHYFSLSFACPAVLANTGRPAEEHLPDVRRALKDSLAEKYQPMSADTKVPLTENRPMSWTEYLRLESELLNCIGAENPIKDLIIAAATLAVEAQNDGEISLSQSPPKPDLIGETIGNFPLFSVHMIAVLEEIEVENNQIRGLALLDGPAYKSKHLNGPMPEFEIGRPQDSMTKDAVERYLKNLIVGKQLIFGAPLVTRLLMLATSLALLFYYLDFRKQQKQTETIEFEDLLWAFDLIEVNLFTHNEGLIPFFLQYERLVVAAAGR